MAAHRQAAAADTRPFDALVADARLLPPPRPFRDALARGRALIAEVKRRSPSKGDLAPDLVPGVLAKAYEAGGAACLSVLTDAEFFGALPTDLSEARAACELPVLRKDFTVSERDVCDARIMGADAVLLIVAALSDDELSRFGAVARGLGLAALVEVHTEHELGRALATGADLIGVNQRDLTHVRGRRRGWRPGSASRCPTAWSRSQSRASVTGVTWRGCSQPATTPSSSESRS